MKKILVALVLAFFTLGLNAQQLTPLPLNPDVITGKLDNGLTYFILKNSYPEKRADFFIAQKVGSMQEEDNQAGLAHFLEHMAFNGLKHFPGKAMLQYMERNGVKFGNNINAYTSFDETVYNLSDVPTREGLLDSSLLVLYDWACGIMLEDKEIDDERGVIREEWRTRGGAMYRTWEQQLPVMYKGSKYANRLPIGSIDVINNFKYDEIRDYYRKWYRPDLQGIIIVGDFDPIQMEAKVKKLFSAIPKPVNPAERVYYPVPDNKEPLIAIAKDDETTRTTLDLYFKHDAIPAQVKLSEQGYMLSYLQSLISSILNERFAEIGQKPDAPFSGAQGYYSEYFVAQTKDAFTLEAMPKEGEVENTLKALLRESLRASKYGFTQSEFERAKIRIEKSYENRYNNRDKVKNTSHASSIASYFTENNPMPGIEYTYNNVKKLNSIITIDMLNAVMKQMMRDDNIVIALSAPTKANLPSNDRLLACFAEVKAENIENVKEEIINEPLISKMPAPGKIVEAKAGKFGETVLTLSNGVTVLLKQTDFKKDEVQIQGTTYGGKSIFPDSEYANMQVLNSVATVGGLGNFSAINLRKALAGKVVNVKSYVDDYEFGVNGVSSVSDVETMLQVIYLTFTAPRKDPEAFEAYLKRLETNLKNAEADPMATFSDTYLNVLYGENSRFRRFKYEDISKISYDRVFEMYKQCFSSADGYKFVIIGNFDVEAIKPMVEQYIASIPKGKPSKYNILPSPNPGVVEKVFQKEMKQPKATVLNYYSGKMEYSLINMLHVSFINQILDSQFTEQIREKEGGTYGVMAQGSIAYSIPKRGQTQLTVMFDTDPKKEKFERLNGIVKQILNDVAEGVIEDDDFVKAKEYLLKMYDQNDKTNEYWKAIIMDYYQHSIDRRTDYMATLEKVDKSGIQAFFKNFIGQNNAKTIIMYCEEEAK